jgi:hypothetical protein
MRTIIWNRDECEGFEPVVLCDNERTAIVFNPMKTEKGAQALLNRLVELYGENWVHPVTGERTKLNLRRTNPKTGKRFYIGHYEDVSPSPTA